MDLHLTNIGIYTVNKKLHIDVDFAGKKCIFSNEAHYHFWENTHMVLKNSMQRTVWCDLWSGGIIGPYFFENKDGEIITTMKPIAPW